MNEEVAKGIEAPKQHTYGLGFAVQNGSVIFNSGYCRPATAQEVILWEALTTRLDRIEAEVAQVRGTRRRIIGEGVTLEEQ